MCIRHATLPHLISYFLGDMFQLVNVVLVQPSEKHSSTSNFWATQRFEVFGDVEQDWDLWPLSKRWLCTIPSLTWDDSLVQWETCVIGTSGHKGDQTTSRPGAPDWGDTSISKHFWDFATSATFQKNLISGWHHNPFKSPKNEKKWSILVSAHSACCNAQLRLLRHLHLSLRYYSSAAQNIRQIFTNRLSKLSLPLRRLVTSKHHLEILHHRIIP